MCSKSVYIVPTKHDPNEIVLAMPTKTQLEGSTFASRASQLSQDQKLEFDIGSYIRSGFREPALESSAARILLDKDRTR